MTTTPQTSESTLEFAGQTVDGLPVSGTLQSSDPTVAKSLLESIHLRLLALRIIPGAPRAIKADDFITLNEHLAQLIAAGFPMERGLRLIAADAGSRRLRAAIEAVAGELEKGLPPAEAFAVHQQSFPPLYGELVQLGIRSGNLSGVLFNLNRHRALTVRMKRTIASTLAYPITVLLFLLAVMGLVSLYVLPTTDQLFHDLHLPLPWLTAIFLAIGPFIIPVGIALVALLLLAPLVWRGLRMKASGRTFTDALFRKLPIIGPAWRMQVASRWCDAARISVETGAPLDRAITLAGDLVATPALQADSVAMIEALRAGRSLDDLPPGRLLPALVPTTIALAGRRGELPAGLAALADMYAQQFERRLVVFPAIVTPLLLLVLGTSLLLALLSIFMPLISLIQTVYAGS